MARDEALSWRPIERGDVEGWSALIAAVQVADHDREYYGVEGLLDLFQDPYRDFPRGSVGIFDGTAIVGYGTLMSRTAADPEHQMRYWGAVHPEYRGRGLGGRLLDWAESAAVPLHRDRYPGRPLALSTYTLSGNREALALHEAHGYRPVRWFHGMARDLSAPLPEAAEPAGFEIVGLTPDAWEHARLLRNDAFRDHWGSTEMTPESWAHFMAVGAYRSGYSFIAYGGDQPLGFVIGHEYEGVTEATGHRDAYIALVGTGRAARKRGVAFGLLSRVLAAAKAAGCDTASLGVDADSPTGALGLYQRAGFTMEHTSVTHLKSLPG
ncbi:GNAT family N-acetyltransferase [Rugosimonospora africana]|nr:GNAT family N-acetyltransferase [Rugosimonospora africana]